MVLTGSSGVDRVAVVTDSTACLPAELVASLGIRVVPLHVVVSGTSLEEGTEISPAEVAEALRDHRVVSTSKPTPEAFSREYRAAATAGAEAVVSIHLSGALSGTADSALVAAEDSPIPVVVVDSMTMGLGLGFGVLDAVRLSRAGATPKEIALTVRRRAAASRVLFYVDTLEYLRRGGRIGSAAALLGSALSVKPLLHLVAGRVEPLERIRTRSRALARLADLAVDFAGSRAVDVGVQHLDNPEAAADLVRTLRDRIPVINQLMQSEVGAVIGAHVGPGMLATVVAPSQD